MNTTITSRLASLATAFVMTFAMLATIETLATSPAHTGVLAQTVSASQPA